MKTWVTILGLLLQAASSTFALELVERFRFTPGLPPGTNISNAYIVATHKDGSVLLNYRAGRETYVGLAPDGELIFRWQPQDFVNVTRETNLVERTNGVFEPQITERTDRAFSSLISSDSGTRPLVWLGNRRAIVIEYSLRSLETRLLQTNSSRPNPRIQSQSGVTNRLIKYERNAEVATVLLLARTVRVEDGKPVITHAVPPINNTSSDVLSLPRSEPHRYSKLLIPHIDGQTIVIYEVRDPDVFPDASITVSSRSANAVQMQASASGERNILLESSNDLRTWHPVADLAAEDDPLLNVVLPLVEPMKFLRLRER